ncbi:MAG: class I SAM-dependent methyltransferase [Verrucomicrobiota bacterium]
MQDILNKAECRRIFDELYAGIFKGGFQDETMPLDFDRIFYYLEVLAGAGLLHRGVRLLDLAGGLSIFSPLLTKYGVKVTIVDDFGGGGGVRYDAREEDLKILKIFREELGIDIIEMNFLEQEMALSSESFDVVTCFHSLEHWHHSPKFLFGELSRVLRAEGYLFLATPNAVNIRKRVFVLFGKSNFPRLEDWYDEPVYRGHVREPILVDLCRLLEWNDYRVISTSGRNFIGRRSKVMSFLPASCLRWIAVGMDYVLRFFPTLCSDIHVLGQKLGETPQGVVRRN